MRLLTREDFGLWAAIAVSLQLLRAVSETSVNMVAIQHREGDTPGVLMTAWWFNALRGLLLGVLLVAVAPVLAGYFHEPRLVNLFRLVSVVLLMEGLVSAGVITATRGLAFNRLVLVQQGSAMVAVVSAIVLGVVFRNVLALVLAEMIRVTLLLVFSFLILPVRPRFAGSVGKARELWKLSKHLYLAQVFEFLRLQGDVFVVGRVLATAQLGVYRLAFAFGTLPSMFLTSVVNRIIFPAFAKMQDDVERLRGALLRVQRFIVMVALPVCLGIAALAPAVAAFGGREAGPNPTLRYAGMVFPLQMFALGVYVTGITSINVSVLLGLGHLDVIKRLKLFHLLLVAAAVYPLTRYWGIAGTALITFLEMPVWVLVARFNGKRIGCGVREQLQNQLFILAPASAMALTIGVLWLLLGRNSVAYAVGVLVLSPAAYLGTLRLGAPHFLRELLEVLRQALNRAPAGTQAEVQKMDVL
jgi:O-antigen/teichoic acid export membrane protein